jgi:two-component system, OmpR family, KDP operon response regulator KdpE
MPNAKEQAMGLQRTRILVVEHDRALGDFIQRTLKGQGFEVTITADQQRGLAAITAQPPNLILLSLDLPTSDSLAACQELRRHADAPIIVFATFDDDAKNAAALAQGADDFLSAPFSADDLLARVRLVLRRHAMGFLAYA